jgi:hypothetical protein
MNKKILWQYEFGVSLYNKISFKPVVDDDV